MAIKKTEAKAKTQVETKTAVPAAEVKETVVAAKTEETARPSPFCVRKI